MTQHSHPRVSRIVTAALLLSVGVTGCADGPTTGISIEHWEAPVYQHGFPPGHALADSWIVVFNDDVASPAPTAEALVRLHGGELRHVYEHALKGFAARLPAHAVEALSRSRLVHAIEQDAYGERDHVQDPAPWQLDRLDERALTLDGKYAHFWTGAGVNIYILDTGLFSTHPQVLGRVRPGWNVVNNTSDTSDCYLGHGTAVTSQAAGSVVGVAKEASIWPVVVECGTVQISNIVAGLDWVRGNHQKPAVANLSYSFVGSSFSLEVAVLSLLNAGVAFTTSAGNSGQYTCDWTPNRLASTSATMTVGATNTSDNRAGTSGYGSCVTLFAPGVGNEVMSLDGSTEFRSGTSYSAPLVAGATALVLQRDPHLTPEQVKNTIHGRATVTPVGNAGSGSPNRILWTPMFSLQSKGTRQIQRAGWYTWEALPSNTNGFDLTYRWEHRLQGSAVWQIVGYSRTYTRWVDPAVDESNFELRVRGTYGPIWLDRLHAVDVYDEPDCWVLPNGTLYC